MGASCQSYSWLAEEGKWDFPVAVRIWAFCFDITSYTYLCMSFVLTEGDMLLEGTMHATTCISKRCYSRPGSKYADG